jgi:protein-S-isoprenylcysteine O-methyltransferase Ste14
MTSELLFRLIFTAVWLVFISTLSWVRLRAHGVEHRPSAESPSRKPYVALSMLSPVWLVGIILYIFYPSAIALLSMPLPAWLRFAMVAVAVPAIPFVIWGYLAIGRNWVHALDAATFRDRKDQALVTSGPYRCVRNPIYLGCFAIVLALSLLAANWIILVPAVGIVVLIYRQIPEEEAMLLERFGDPYREYSARTPRIVPRFR